MSEAISIPGLNKKVLSSRLSIQRTESRVQTSKTSRSEAFLVRHEVLAWETEGLLDKSPDGQELVAIGSVFISFPLFNCQIWFFLGISSQFHV